MSNKNLNISGGFSCPIPIKDYPTIQLAHGSGGKLMGELIDKMFAGTFQNPILSKMEDQASISIYGSKISFTTDTFVVDPIFFPGGNIGDLAVNGTVNDLCMNGSTPLYLSVGMILEEGFSMEDLHRITLSIKSAADKAGVSVVTGDTKVVNKGSCDKIFINTSGLGVLEKNLNISAGNLESGDSIIVSGTIADHGMAIMTCREGLSFERSIESDSASLNSLVNQITGFTNEVHAMRDPTRGGVAASLNEFAKKSKKGIKIYSDKIPVKENVKGACELLGLDPLFVANEGKLLVIVPGRIAEDLLKVMKKHPLGKYAEIIGEVTDEHPGLVLKRTLLGVEQIVDLPIGEQLPRIC